MDDLVSEFITETSESLGQLDQELVKFEQNPGDEAILGSIFRLVHTIKGTCGFLGLPRLEAIAHASENVLGKMRDKSLAPSTMAISLVLESLDTIKMVVDYLSQQGAEPEGSDAELIGRLNRFAEGGGAAAAATPTAPAAAPVAAVEAAPSAPIEPQAASHVAAETPSPTPAAAAEAAPAPAAPEAAPTPPPAAAPTPTAASPAPTAAAAKPAEGGEGAGGGGGNQSIRVNLDVLEGLMQMVSELVLTRNQLLQLARTRQDKDFLAPLQRLSYITTELQEGVMKTRMQPIGNAWSKFPRLIRDLSLELGKKIELRMIGAETELDRQLLELIKDPLTHMVRNSCDHGLEKPEDRLAAGKSEGGTVTLSAFHEGGHIIMEVSDDGRGININRVKEKIIGNGLASAADVAQMNEQQIAQYIFRAGFSTAEKVTSVSGRGVGMDVVKTNIEKMGGTIELRSKQGQGSTFHIKIPLTLAIVSVLIVEAERERFALPQINVLELVRTGRNSEYRIESLHHTPVLRLRDRLLPLISLANVLELRQDVVTEGDRYIVVCRVGGNDFGLIGDRVHDTEEIVVKPVSSLLQHISIYSGNTVLGDGSVIMILDPNGLARSAGDIDAHTADADAAAQKAGAGNDRRVNFLLFRAGELGAPKAVPLELVSRLEEIDAATIESSGQHPVVQYRGELMRLVTLNDSYAIPSEGVMEVIVFTYDRKIVGLVVQQILDIVEAVLDIKVSSKETAYLGSQVIQGKTTDVVDVGYVLGGVIDSVAAAGNVVKDDRANNHRLLLVEDSPFFRNLTVPFLLAVGYNVVAVESVSEALVQLNKQSFDVIVSDIEMPDIDGFEFAAMCRSTQKLASIPMIAFTSTINPNLLERGREAGFRNYIVKTDREGLVKAIAEQLYQEREAA